MVATGGIAQAEELLNELMAAGPDLAYVGMRELASAMTQLGRRQEFLERAEMFWRSPWLEAGIAIASGQFNEAAHVYATIGAKPDEAEARIAAAEDAAADGHPEEAERQLTGALEFYRRVGAGEYVRRGEALMASLG